MKGNDTMKLFLGCGGILLVGLLIVAMIGVRSYNRMVTMSEGIDAQWAEVENQLKRRNDLIPNLVETVKGYAAHEKEIFTDIAEARSKLAGAGSVRETAAADGAMQSALSRLLVIVERYPDLKADRQFIALQSQLEGTENRITVARGRYNESVRAFNVIVKRIPGRFFAAIFGFGPREFFEVPEAEQAVPKVDFGTNK